MNRRIWITWEYQRRSIELAKHFNCKLYLIQYSGALRFPLSILSTVKILIREKLSKDLSLVIVQNPSMLLAGLACLFGVLFKTFIIVDRHSNFLLTEKKRSFFYLAIFNFLHYFTIKKADITIITNNFLAQKIKKIGGNPFILPDKIPSIQPTMTVNLKGRQNLLLISSFHKDEPTNEVIKAMKNLIAKDIYLYVSGDYRKLDKKTHQESPDNVIFTGFLDEKDFINTLFAVDVIIVLTKIDYCMLCGCYEAVAAKKPLITSRRQVLMDYFKHAVFVDNTYQDIAKGILYILENKEIYHARMIALKDKLMSKWEGEADLLEEIISKMEDAPKL